MRYTGQGGAELIRHLGALRRTTAAEDEAYVAGHATASERAEAAERVTEVRDARRQMYTKSRLTAEAVPFERANLNAANRVDQAGVLKRRGQADVGRAKREARSPDLYASKGLGGAIKQG
jgi:hypothetical protein